MISARLIKRLEREGFSLDFPGYDSKEEIIKEIIKEENPRLSLAIPSLLKDSLDYNKIISGIGKALREKFNKIILITEMIFKKDTISDRHIKKIISENKIKARISESEFKYYYDSYEDSARNMEEDEEEKLEEQMNMRRKLSINKALEIIFSPAKIRIMDKIFHHEQLTNTELKYYYRAIRPLAGSILNENMKNYLMIIESSRKYKI